MKYGFGVDLGGTTVKLAWFEEEGGLLHKWEIPTDIRQGGKHILPDIAKALLDFLAEAEVEKSQVLGIGIGVPGPVDEAGVVNQCNNLGWGVLNIHQILQELTGLPVKAGNDANLAALGELWKGGGRGCQSMVMVTLGTGVGGGIILEGKPLAGAHGAAGEIGHIVVNAQEKERCTCGNYGCAEQYCSATGIVRMMKRRLAETKEASVLRNGEFDCKAVFDAAAAGDLPAGQVLEQVYDYLGRMIAIVCSTVNPESVVLGGGVSKAGQVLTENVKKYFEGYVFHACRNISFALATLGNDAGVYGAFKSILDTYKNEKEESLR